MRRPKKSNLYVRRRDSAADYEAFSAQRIAPRWIKTLIRFGYTQKPG